LLSSFNFITLHHLKHPLLQVSIHTPILLPQLSKLDFQASQTPLGLLRTATCLHHPRHFVASVAAFLHFIQLRFALQKNHRLCARLRSTPSARVSSASINVPQSLIINPSFPAWVTAAAAQNVGKSRGQLAEPLPGDVRQEL
jgi:hypothetical protein